MNFDHSVVMMRAAASAVVARSCMDCTIGEAAWKAVVHSIAAVLFLETEGSCHKEFRGPHLQGLSVVADNSYMPMEAQVRVGAAVVGASPPSCVGDGAVGTQFSQSFAAHHLLEKSTRESGWYCLDVESCVDFVAP